jgi:hypothetical protein
MTCHIEKFLNFLNLIIIENNLEGKISKNTIFNYVIYNDYPSNSAKTIYKGQNCNDSDSIIRKIKSLKLRDGGILRNALGEGLAAALEIFKEDKYKDNKIKKYCIIISNTAFYNTKVRYSKKYFRKDIDSLIEEYKKNSIDISIFTTIGSMEPDNNILEKVNNNKGRIYENKQYIVRLDGLKTPTKLFAEFVTRNEKDTLKVQNSTIANEKSQQVINKTVKNEEKLQTPISLINKEINKEPVHIPLQNEKKNVENIKQLKFIEEQQKKHQNYINKTQTSSSIASPASSIEMNVTSQSNSLLNINNIKNNNSNTVAKQETKITNKINNVSNSKNNKIETINKSANSIVTTPTKTSNSNAVNMTTPIMNSSSISSTTTVKIENNKKTSTPNTPNYKSNKVVVTSAATLSNIDNTKVQSNVKSSGITTPVNPTSLSSNTSSSTKIANSIETTSNPTVPSPAITINTIKNISPVLNPGIAVSGATDTINNSVASQLLKHPIIQNITQNQEQILLQSKLQLENARDTQVPQGIATSQPTQAQAAQLLQQSSRIRPQVFTQKILNQQKENQQQQSQPQKTPVQPPISLLQNKVAANQKVQAQVQAQTLMALIGQWKGQITFRNDSSESVFNLIAVPNIVLGSQVKVEDYLLKSWPQKLTIERILNGNISKFIEANKAIMPFVKFEPQEHDKVNYATLVSYLSEKPSFGLIRFNNSKELKDNQGLLLFPNNNKLYAVVFIRFPITKLINQIYLNQNISPQLRANAQALKAQVIQQQLKNNSQLLQNHANQILTTNQAVKVAQAAAQIQAIQGQTQTPVSHIPLSATPSALGLAHTFPATNTDVPIGNIQNQRIQYPLPLQSLQLRQQNSMMLQQPFAYQNMIMQQQQQQQQQQRLTPQLLMYQMYQMARQQKPREM